MKKIGVAVLLAMSTIVLAAAPSGWKVVTDRKKTCQYAVPADWTVDTLLVGTATSADKKSNVVVHGNEQSLANIKPIIQQMIPPDKTIEDNGKRYWYSYKHLANAGDLPGRIGMWLWQRRAEFAPRRWGSRIQRERQWRSRLSTRLGRPSRRLEICSVSLAMTGGY